jgi:hypothetical protein
MFRDGGIAPNFAADTVVCFDCTTASSVPTVGTWEGKDLWVRHWGVSHWELTQYGTDRLSLTNCSGAATMLWARLEVAGDHSEKSAKKTVDSIRC